MKPINKLHIHTAANQDSRKRGRASMTKWRTTSIHIKQSETKKKQRKKERKKKTEWENTDCDIHKGMEAKKRNQLLYRETGVAVPSLPQRHFSQVLHEAQLLTELAQSLIKLSTLFRLICDLIVSHNFSPSLFSPANVVVQHVLSNLVKRREYVDES